MNKTSTTIKNAIVLNFDGTLYWNPREDFSINIDIRSIIDAKSFFTGVLSQIKNDPKMEIILVTGRPAHQEKTIMYLLMIH